MFFKQIVRCSYLTGTQDHCSCILNLSCYVVLHVCGCTHLLLQLHLFIGIGKFIKMAMETEVSDSCAYTCNIFTSFRLPDLPLIRWVLILYFILICLVVISWMCFSSVRQKRELIWKRVQIGRNWKECNRGNCCYKHDILY